MNQRTPLPGTAGFCPPFARGTFQMGEPDTARKPIDRLLPRRAPRLADRRCAFCAHPLQDFRDRVSAAEAAITSQCQCCQDKTDIAALRMENDDRPCPFYSAHPLLRTPDGTPVCRCGFDVVDHDEDVGAGERAEEARRSEPPATRWLDQDPLDDPAAQADLDRKYDREHADG